ncbi:hypothetical protein [Tsukamurella pulmonis]|uniref:hypothetical protein n=1 Tax=Tsukamurella pulmonis TaxID=47312 RepID=UPI001EDF542F|nr:hypothetical protein [Tsukamurella pulmonis]
MNDTDLTRWMSVELRRLADPNAPGQDARHERLQRALTSSDPVGYEPATIWSTIGNLTAYWLGEAAAEAASQVSGIHLDLSESVEAHNAAERIVQAERADLVDAVAEAHAVPRDYVRDYVRDTWFATDQVFVNDQILRLAMFEVGRHHRATVGVMRDQAAAQGVVI